MRIDFPNHPVGRWQQTPWWMFWRPRYRRLHWRWTVDWNGCECNYRWQYESHKTAEPTDDGEIVTPINGGIVA